MTLIEMLVAITLLSIVIGVAVGSMRQQSIVVALGNSQMRVLQNQRFTLATLEKDLRGTGVGVPLGQPFLVYADSMTIAFNANLVSENTGDLTESVYVDPSAGADASNAATLTDRFRIPGTSIFYPDTSYNVGAGNSPAETIIFNFARDSSTARTDDYVLYRQVNGLEREPVARGILRSGALPFFRYVRRVAPVGQAERLETIPSNRLLYHSARRHGSPADAGSVALIDSVRAVEINLRTTSGEQNATEQVRIVKRLVQLPNAGIARLSTCGSKPAFSGVITAQPGVLDSQPAITLGWNPAADESGGEHDVLRYVIWRKTDVADPWGDPHTSISVAGTASYQYEDRALEPNTQYFYAIAAQDCTPSLSTAILVNATTLP